MPGVGVAHGRPWGQGCTMQAAFSGGAAGFRAPVQFGAALSCPARSMTGSALGEKLLRETSLRNSSGSGEDMRTGVHFAGSLFLEEQLFEALPGQTWVRIVRRGGGAGGFYPWRWVCGATRGLSQGARAMRAWGSDPDFCRTLSHACATPGHCLGLCHDLIRHSCFPVPMCALFVPRLDG